MFKVFAVFAFVRVSCVYGHSQKKSLYTKINHTKKSLGYIDMHECVCETENGRMGKRHRTREGGRGGGGGVDGKRDE